MEQTDFHQKLSASWHHTQGCIQVLTGAFPQYRFEEHEANWDDGGVDLWMVKGNQSASIDLKVQQKTDWYPWKGMKELPLEEWSNEELGKVGWSMDVTKETKFIFFYWLDSKRWHLIRFKDILEYCQTEDFKQRQSYKNQTGDLYHSSFKWVPSEQFECIKEWLPKRINKDVYLKKRYAEHMKKKKR